MPAAILGVWLVSGRLPVSATCGVWLASGCLFASRAPWGPACNMLQVMSICGTNVYPIKWDSGLARLGYGSEAFRNLDGSRTTECRAPVEKGKRLARLLVWRARRLADRPFTG